MAIVASTETILQRLGAINMPSVFASWLGQSVILQLANEDLRIPLRGVIVGESESAIRFLVGEGWEIDIFKPMILAVEQDCLASFMVN